MDNTAQTTPGSAGRGASRGLVLQGLFLLLIWLVFSGKLDAFHVGAGVVAVLIILWLDRKLGSAAVGETEAIAHPHAGRLLRYVPWLAWQMLLSSWHVATLVLSPRMHERLNPRVVTFRSDQPHVIAKVALGNSITLTPATLTLHIDGDRFYVHSLTEESRSSLLEGTMQRKVARVFHRDLDEPVTAAEVLERRLRI